MFNVSEIMRAAWAQYRRIAFKGRPFDRKLFADTLRFVWVGVRGRVAAERLQARRDEEKRIAFAAINPAAPREMSEMERRIDALKYMPFRYSIAAAEAAIRAEYAHA